MAKVVHKKQKFTLSNTANQVTLVMDVTNCNGASFQLNGAASTAGSMKLQYSNDSNNWEDIPSATSTLAASEANIINQTGIYTGFVRLLVTLSGGAGEYEIFGLAKEH